MVPDIPEILIHGEESNDVPTVLQKFQKEWTIDKHRQYSSSRKTTTSRLRFIAEFLEKFRIGYEPVEKP
jgi:hypothetical protein